MSKPSGSSEPAGAVDVTTLSVPQLRALQTRLSTELEHLTTSHAKLRTAQSKFRECIRSIDAGVVKSATEKAEGKSEILVPLTNSLYVKGQLADREKVIVDVGTGFYVEKSTSKAIEFYNGKVEELQTNLRDLEKVLQAKTTNHRVIEDVLRQKLLAGEGAAVPSSSGGGGGA
ncbi:prefoldin, alpha subunit [Coccidioides immitis RS]|uniref:Prefoldin, alpha subunit n=2 Tax=Coccidioides immitis TaxID=5501 RepID=J3K975_COCIM|nr:prefoldin, alpha subunit [Coccidioides immitis RS]EAS31429.3 prefoldin, alpha subunit [Coccidioides immitis RS]KMU86223.1 c-myc binding protein [Coccidioides immitis H538.4]TPX24220.1 subunit of tubulin prefoldin [Coccidioides immitis]